MFLEFVSVRLDDNIIGMHEAYHGMRVPHTPVSAEPIQQTIGQRRRKLRAIKFTARGWWLSICGIQSIATQKNIHRRLPFAVTKNSCSRTVHFIAVQCLASVFTFPCLSQSAKMQEELWKKLIFCPLLRDMIAQVLEIEMHSLSFTHSFRNNRFPVRQFMVFSLQ